MPRGVKEPYAEEITQAEYEAIKRDEPDEEDTDPIIPDESAEPPLTRAELTAKIAELEEQNSFLTDCILEMSEMIYA